MISWTVCVWNTFNGWSLVLCSIQHLLKRLQTKQEKKKPIMHHK